MMNLVGVITRFTRKTSRPVLTIFALATALTLLVWSSTAAAQSGAGSIQGTVTDATGAVIPGAKIHVVNNGTNATAEYYDQQ